MANEKGVWRTIGGRRVFIKEGQDLASAMKESGKFKSAKKFSKREELKKDIAHQITEAEKNGNTAHAEAGKRELERLNNEEKAKKMNETMDKRSEIIDKLNKETAELDNYDTYNLAVSKLENTEGMRPTERQYWAGIKERYEKDQKANSDREALRNTEKEYGELSKKMQADDYYYKPEDDRKLKELRAKADSERARQGIDTQEKYDKLMSEDSNKGKYQLPSKEDIIKEYNNYSNDIGTNVSKDKFAGEYAKNLYDNGKIGLADFEQVQKDIKDNLKGAKTSNDTDLNKFNDKAKAKFGKIDYNGTGRKVNDVEIEMELKDGVFRASGSIKNARGTDSLSGGQNIDEIADLMKDNKDVQEIRDLWHKYHLNNLHAGTEKQEDALMKKFGNRNASDYDKHVEYLKSVGLYEDDGYKYGTGWLKREIPDNDKRRIISLIDKYNGKNTNTETSNKTTNQSMNDALRNAFNDYRKKHKNSNMSFTEFMRINKK